MTGRFFRIFAALCLVGTIGSGTAWSVDSPETLLKIEKRRRLARLGVIDRWQQYKQFQDINNIPLQDAYQANPLDALNRSFVDDYASGATMLSVLDADTLESPGLAVGITSYDSQANASIGREISSNPGSNTVHMAWTMWDIIPGAADETSRYVNYTSWDKPSGETNQGFNGVSVTIAEFARGGFCRQDVNFHNLLNLTLHQRAEEDFPYSSWVLYFPSAGSALYLGTELTKPTEYPDEVEMLWPDIAVEQNGVLETDTVDITHVFSMGAVDVGGGYADPSDRLWYYRYDQGMPVPVWEGPVLIDSTRNLSYTIDADDNSNNVCLAYTSNYSTDGMNSLNNIAYRESQTSGAGWIDGTERGEPNKHFATSYSVAGGPQAWIETSVAYDHAGDLHILFTEQRVANASEHLALKHWSKSRGTTRTVQIAYYDNDGTWGRVLNMGGISLGIGDGSTLCKSSSEANEDYLYAIFVKLGGETPEEEQDMSKLGYANSELWITASNSNGDTWSPPTNLSNTKTPECTSSDADSVCASEAWSSMARDVKDIEIFYILDFESSAFDEAPWAMGRAMYLNYPGGPEHNDGDIICPVIAPNFASYITYEPECEYHANPGEINLEELTILNLGNDNMDGSVTVTAGDAWLSVGVPGDYTIVAGGADIVMDVTMDAAGLSEDLYVGEIQIEHTDPTKTSPRLVPIEFFVVTDFKCPQEEVLRTAVASPGVLSLEVLSNSRFGAQNDEGALWRYLDSSSTIFDATLLLAYGTQPMMTGDTIVFHRFMDGSDPGQQGWRALTDLVIDTSAYGLHAGYAKAWADMTTHAEDLSPDSVVNVRVRWFFPQNPVYGDFVVAKYTLRNRTATPLSDVAIAVWADLDVIEAAHMDALQQGVENHGNFVSAQNLIYQYGYDTVDHVAAGLNTAQRYSGGITYVAGVDATGVEFHSTGSVPLRGAVGDNRDNTTGTRPNSGFFYRTMIGDPGVSVWEPIAHRDSAKDQYSWLLLDQGRTLDAGGANPQVYIVAWVTDTLQHDAYSPTASLAGGLGEVVDSAWSWVSENLYCHCRNHADPQPDGVTNVLDVVQTVLVAFRGGAPVFDDDCPYERSDVDITGFTNVIDVVKIVNVAFRGGLPEDNFKDGCVAGWKVP